MVDASPGSQGTFIFPKAPQWIGARHCRITASLLDVAHYSEPLEQQLVWHLLVLRQVRFIHKASLWWWAMSWTGENCSSTIGTAGGLVPACLSIRYCSYIKPVFWSGHDNHWCGRWPDSSQRPAVTALSLPKIGKNTDCIKHCWIIAIFD